MSRASDKPPGYKIPRSEGVPKDQFDKAYEGRASWDIGRPQRVFVELAEAGLIQGSVLDLGCGPGDIALYLAERGHETWGVDIVEKAIDRARITAEERGVPAWFVQGDVLEVFRLARQFDTVIDSGTFHVLSDQDRVVFETAVASVLRPGGNFFMLCFNEHETMPFGPRRVSQAEIRETFEQGWKIESIVPALYELNTKEEGAQSWLATIIRLK